MGRRKRNKLKKKRKPRGNSSGTSQRRPYALNSTIIRKGPISSGLEVVLHYQDTILSRNNAGAVYCTWRYRMNSAYDPDPLLASGSISGFNEYAALYFNYLVVDFSAHIEVVNNEPQPVVIVWTPTISDLGGNSSLVDQFPEMTNFSGSKVLSAKSGQDRARLNRTINLARFEGSPAWYVLDTYGSSVTTNPTAVRYFNIGFYASAALTLGVTASVRLTYRVYFSKRRPVAT